MRVFFEPVIIIVGLVISYNTLNCVAAVFPLVAASCTTSAATSTVTLPSVVGVINAEYLLPPPLVDLAIEIFLKSDAVALPNVISLMSNPVTYSEKVNSAVNGAFVGSATELVIVTVGFTVSTKVSYSPFVFPLPAKSSVSSLGTIIVTVPSAVGVIVALY